MPDRTQGGACLFGPKQHAVMFGLLAREICRHFGPDADPLLLRAVETYGEERGRRMAARCRQNGDPLDDMASYFAYCEWSWPGESLRTENDSQCSHVSFRMLKCPWHTAWQESGLADFGFYYGKPKTKILEYAPLLTSERVAIVRADHPLAAKKVISISELDGEPLICNYSRDDSDFLGEIGGAYGFQPNILFECDNSQIEMALLGAGRGISLTPLPCFYRYLDLEPTLPISYLRFQELLPASQMGIVRRQGVRLTDSALDFLQKTAEYFSADRCRILEKYPEELSDAFWHVEFDGKTE